LITFKGTVNPQGAGKARMGDSASISGGRQTSNRRATLAGRKLGGLQESSRVKRETIRKHNDLGGEIGQTPPTRNRQKQHLVSGVKKKPLVKPWNPQMCTTIPEGQKRGLEVLGGFQ